MTRPIIRFQSVSKYYRRRQSRSLREAFVRSLSRRAADGLGPDEFWALENVSFDIAPGEVVGLIGPNGAGKSTSLKLVSRVVQPTRGRVDVYGRVGALLELGAGFHPDLSGRDNVYLNAALLGLSRREVQRQFDAIVAFSELEAFLDTPVKHYSSGMFMRLAFAVNVHVDPEILLVDEVLAVGDNWFQRKCVNRIGEMRRQGVTILFVSHSQDLVRSICDRVLWLDHGRVRADGPADRVTRQYLSHDLDRMEAAMRPRAGAGPRPAGGKRAEITRVTLLDEAGQARSVFQTGQRLVIALDYVAHEPIPSPVFGLAIHRQDGAHVCGPNTDFAGLKLPDLAAAGRIEYTVPYLPLLDGLYLVSASLHDREGLVMYDYLDRQISFRVENRPDSRVKERYGLMTLQGVWTHHAGARA